MNKTETGCLLSVILPVYNKQNSIPVITQLLKKIIEGELRIFDYEIIYVDDNSTDNSLSILESIQNEHTRILHHPHNQGQVKAIETGLRAATGKVLAVYSCDMQNSFETIVPLYQALANGYELAVGYRAVRSDSGLGVLMSKLFFGLLSVVNKKMPSGGFDYGLFNQRICRGLLAKDFNGVFIQLEVLRLSNKTYYLPTERINDTFDKSSWTFGSKLKYAIRAFSYVFKK